MNPHLHDDGHLTLRVTGSAQTRHRAQLEAQLAEVDATVAPAGVYDDARPRYPHRMPAFDLGGEETNARSDHGLASLSNPRVDPDDRAHEDRRFGPAETVAKMPPAQATIHPKG
jgi:hypothetical protein